LRIEVIVGVGATVVVGACAYWADLCRGGRPNLCRTLGKKKRALNPNIKTLEEIQ
jgi:hypothetical protein